MTFLIPVVYSFVHYKALERRGAADEPESSDPASFAPVDPARDSLGAGDWLGERGGHLAEPARS